MTAVVDQTQSVVRGRGRALATWRSLVAKGPPVIHPFLMAAFPIVFLFARNLRQAITPSDMVTPLELSIGGTAIFMIVGWAIFRNAKAVGLVVSVWLLLFFSYGRASNGLQGKLLGRNLYLVTVWGIIAIAAVVVAFLARARLRTTTSMLNLVTAALVTMNVIPIVLYRPAIPSGSASLGGSFAKQLKAAQSIAHSMPDIYYIVPEDYGEARTLRDLYGIDTQPFNRWLKKQGFYVATDTKANYQNTYLSLGAVLNLQYLSSLLGEAAKDEDVVKRTVRGFQASRFLQALGYRYVHMGFWYAPTSKDPTADVEVREGGLSEFSSILYDTTILPALSTKVKSVGGVGLDWRHDDYEFTLHQLDNLLQASKLRGPKFFFVHLGIPHKPFVFDRNGHFVTDEARAAETLKKAFGDQVLWTNDKLEEVLGRLLKATGRKAVIILQTDEGPDPVNYPQVSEGGPDLRRKLLNKFRILNALFLPGVSHDALYPSITPVNTFRLVFDLYFHTGFGLLPDEIWGREQNPTKFVNITDMFKA